MVSDEIPWAEIIVTLDSGNPQRMSAAASALEQTLEGSGSNAQLWAGTLAPLVGELITVGGRRYGLDLLAKYTASVPEVRALMLKQLNDDQPGVRLRAAQHIAQELPARDPEVRTALFRLMGDNDREVRDFAIGLLPELANAPNSGVAISALRVLADPEQEGQALELLDRLERSVHTLQDLGLEPAQNDIVNKIILPSISELRAILPAESADSAEVASSRRTAVQRLGGLLGSTNALATIIVGAANVDDALANFEAAAAEVSTILGWILDAL